MRFEAWPFAFLLLMVPALALLYAYAFRERRRALATFIQHGLSSRLVPATTRRRRGRAALLLGAIVCFVVALMQPKWGEGEAGMPLQGRDIAVVLDVSLSMLAEDTAPNRLARAKAAARSLIEAAREDGGHRLALLTFAGRADVQAPLTRDDRLLLERLDAANVEEVAQRGSALGGALAQAMGMLGDVEPAFTDLVLISDGEDHGGGAVAAARALAAEGFTLHTVGIGDPGRAVPVPLTNGTNGAAHLVYQGQEVRTRTRHGTLAAMAEAGGGAFVAATDGTSLAGLYRDHIDARPRREIASGANTQVAHRFQIFVAAAIVLLGLEMAMRERKGAAV